MPQNIGQGSLLLQEGKMLADLNEKDQDICFYTDGKERLRITEDGRFIVNSIIEVDQATEADKIYYALRDVFLGNK